MTPELKKIFAEMALKGSVDSSWRILPLDAKPSDKFTADMKFMFTGEFPSGEMYAYGEIYNDSRNLFMDGEEVRTSAVKNIYVGEDRELYIETRNSMYRVLNPELLV